MDILIEKLLELSEEELNIVITTGKEDNCPRCGCSKCVFTKISRTNSCTEEMRRLLGVNSIGSTNLGRAARKMVEIYESNSIFIKF